jgi:fucose permease
MTSAASLRSASALRAVVAGTLAFAVLGVPDGGTGVAWPFMRADLHQPLDALGLTTVAATAGAVGVSALSGRLTRRLGVVRPLVLASLISGAALTGVSVSPVWAVVVLCFLLLGCGGGLIDAVVQAYVVSRHGLRSMSALHAGYGAGVTLGPLLVTALVTAGAGWRAGYACMAALYAVVIAACVLTRDAWQPATDVDSQGAQAPAGVASREVRPPSVGLSLLLFFLVTGMELSAMLWSFTFLTGARGIGTAPAGIAVGGFFGLEMLTRIGLATWGHRVSAPTVLRACCAAIGAGAALMLLLPGTSSLVGLAVAGTGLGGVYPSLMVASSGSLGTHRAQAVVGYQVAAANLGAAAGSGLTGVVLARAGVGAFPLVLLVIVAVVALLVAALPRRASVH